MPNGPSWPVVAIGASRAGATIVPLSTFLRPPELAAQLRVAGVEHLVRRAHVPRSRLRRRPRGDLARARRRAAAWRSTRCRACGRSRCGTTTGPVRRLPRTRRELVDALDAAVRPADDLAIVFTSGSRGDAQGRDPHPRRRAGRDRGRARGPPPHRRRPALHPDALLLGGRVRHRPALDAGRRGHAAHRGPPGAASARCRSSNASG